MGVEILNCLVKVRYHLFSPIYGKAIYLLFENRTWQKLIVKVPMLLPFFYVEWKHKL